MIIVASNGCEVIDNRPEAENADSLAKHFENRYAREQKCKLAKQLHKKFSSPLRGSLISILSPTPPKTQGFYPPFAGQTRK